MSAWRRLGAAMVTIVVVTVPQAATADAPRQTPTEDDVELTLQMQPMVLRPGETWKATYAVEDLQLPATPTTTRSTSTTEPSTSTSTTSSTVRRTPATEPPDVEAPDVEVRVSAHRRIEDPVAMAAALDGAADVIVSRRTVPATITTSGSGSTLSVSMPTTTDPDDDEALLLSRSGLYPLTVDLVVGDEIVASHSTFVERLPTVPDDDAMPVNIAVVGEVEDPGPAADAAGTAEARSGIRDLVRSADALGGTISARVPPSIVTTLPPSTRNDLAEALDGAEVLATPRLALDPSSAVAVDQGATFSAELRAGEDELGAAMPNRPPLRSAWLAGSTGLSAPAAAMLREPLGFDLLVFDQDTYNGLEGGIGGFHDPTLAFDVDLGDGNTLPGFVFSPLSRWLDAEELERRGLSPTDGAVTLLAELLVWRRQYGADLRRSVVLELPTDSTAEPGVLSALAELVDAAPDLDLATLSALPASTDVMEVPERGPEVVTLPASAGIDLSARVERINLARLHAAGAGSMLVDQTRAEAWDAGLDELLSTAVDDDVVDERIERISTEAQEVYDRVEAPRPFTFTLTGRSSTLRLNLTNTGDEELRVVVHPTSPKLTFPNGDVPKTLAANDSTEVVLEVEARTNGTSSIAIEVLTPVNSLNVEGPIVLTARVNALSGLGQVVTGGALLVLLSWWYGHFRRRRRERRALLGEVDNPGLVDAAMSPDAAEATVTTPATGSVSQP
jgi:hypothetical protein